MSNLFPYQKNARPQVAIFSDANFLAIGLVEVLLSQMCLVEVFTEDIKSWQQRTFHIKNNSSLEILYSNEVLNKNIQTSYCVCFLGFINPNEIKTKLNKIKLSPLFSKSKTLVVLPLEASFYKLRLSKYLKTGDVGIVYLGDLLGARIDIQSSLCLPTLLRDVLGRGILEVNKEEVFYPLFISEATKTLLRWLFSFGPYGKKTYLLGTPLSAQGLYGELKRFYPTLPVSYKENTEIRHLRDGIEKNTLPSSPQFLIKETLTWLKDNFPKTVDKKVTAKRTKNFSLPALPKFSFSKHNFVYFFLLIILLLSPYLLLLASGLAAMGIYKSAVKGNLSGISFFAKIAKPPAYISQFESRIFENVPLLGRMYKESDLDSEIILTTSDTVLKGASLVSLAASLTDNVLGSEDYDLERYTEKIKLDLDDIYRRISFLQGELRESFFYNRFLFAKVSQKTDWERMKSIALHGQNLVRRLPLVLGLNEPKTYLVLLQNNMELRPTGGFIGSFSLITLDGGRVSQMQVSDVYSADGQLKGHVEPPLPIKEYLNQPNWYLRDSNWDPDFRVSAQRAEWFLDKEVDKQVDGVVGVDLEFAKLILGQIGPVYLSDFNTTLDASNLYQKTQNEVEDKFFPGSQKKTNFLTSLARQLLTELPNSESKAKLGILKSVVTSLERRHLQIYVHDNAFQKAVSSLGWDGGVNQPQCEGNCATSIAGSVEANLGVNKANYFISRKADLDIYFEDGGVQSELNMKLTNSANPALGADGTYKVYVRSLQDEESGIYEEILPSQSKNVTFSWQDKNKPDFTKSGEFRLYIRKQAGVDAYPLKITIHPPAGVDLAVSREFSLTSGGTYVYNVLLARDFVSRVLW